MTTRSTPSTADSREVILNVAERLMVRNGYDKTSIARICRESRLPVGSLYHHFGSKSALLSQVMERASDRFFASLPARPVSRSSLEGDLEAYWDAAIEAIVENLGYFTLHLELLRMSFVDPELRELTILRNQSSHESIAGALLPFVRAAGHSNADEVAGRLGRVVLVYSQGAVMNSAGSADAIRREMADILPIVQDVITSLRADPPCN